MSQGGFPILLPWTDADILNRTCAGGVYASTRSTVAHVCRPQKDPTVEDSLPPAYPTEVLETRSIQFLRSSGQNDAPV